MGDLAEQRVAAVRRAEVEDRALVGDGHEVALVVGRALAEVLQVAGHVDGLDEGVAQVVDVLHADPRHPDHLEHDVAVVGELDTGGELLHRRALRRHEVGDDVHRLARRGAGHQLDELRLHLGGGLPVVVDALVGLVRGRDDRALLRASGVLVVGARVVAALAGGEQLARVQCLLDQARVVGRGHDLDALCSGDVGPVCDVLTNMRLVRPASSSVRSTSTMCFASLSVLDKVWARYPTAHPGFSGVRIVRSVDTVVRVTVTMTPVLH